MLLVEDPYPLSKVRTADHSVCMPLQSFLPCHWFWGQIVLILFPIWPKSRHNLSRGLRTKLNNTFYLFGSHVVLVPFSIWPFTGLRHTLINLLEQETLVVFALLPVWGIERLRLMVKHTFVKTRFIMFARHCSLQLLTRLRRYFR